MAEIASSIQASAPPQCILPTLDDVLDSNCGGVPKHLGQIADFMYEWEGPVAEHLQLSLADTASIKKKHHDQLKLQQ